MAVDPPLARGMAQHKNNNEHVPALGLKPGEAVDCVTCNFIGQTRELDMWNTSVIPPYPHLRHLGISLVLGLLWDSILSHDLNRRS